MHNVKKKARKQDMSVLGSNKRVSLQKYLQNVLPSPLRLGLEYLGASHRPSGAHSHLLHFHANDTTSR